MARTTGRAPSRRRGGRPRIAEIQQREERLLRVAGDIFLRRGFDNTSMDAVAKAAGISKRTLYARYADKTALFNAVLRDLITRWLIPIGEFQLGPGGLRDTLLALARYLTTEALTPQSVSVHRIIISNADARPEFGRLANEIGRGPALQAIASILRQHCAELQPIDLDIAADQFMSLAVDRSLQLASLGIKMDAKQTEEWVRSSVDLFLNGIKSGTRQKPVLHHRRVKHAALDTIDSD